MSPNDIIVGDGNKNIVSSGVNLLDVLCEGNDYYVTSSGDDSNDGLSWSSPKKTIQGAYDAAVNGDIINVASGTYQFDEEFIVEKGIKIIGVDGPDVTTIERPDAAVDEYRVITLAHYGATLFGFTIRNGYAPSDPLTGNGGNVLITHDAHIENCIIQEGNAWQYGGGVMFGSPGGSMARCIIRNNEVRGASGTGGGGGIYIRTTSTIQSCLIYDNIAPSGGGIGCATNSYGTVIEHCTITKNKAVGWNAGVMVYGGGFVGQQSGHLVACIVWGNFRGDGTTPDDASFVQYGASVVAKSLNNDFGTKTAVFGAVPTDPSNISADPLFVDSGNDDFHLQPSSPCIGIETIHDPLETPFNTIDLDKNIWYSTPYASIGCYSYLGYEGIPINNSSLSSDNLKDAVNELVTLSATMTIISGVPAGPYTVGQYHFDTDLPAMVIYTGNSASGWETAAGVDPY